MIADNAKLSIKLLLALVLVIPLLPFKLFAAECVDVFPNVLSSSSSSGEVKIGQSVLISGTDGSINMGIAADSTIGSELSCGSQRCVDSGDRAAALTLPSFQQSSGTTDVNVANGQTVNLAQGAYDSIFVNFQGTLRFTQNNQTTFIRELRAENSSEKTIIFEEGVYWIEDFRLSSGLDLQINGDDKVILIVNSSFVDEADLQINALGDPEQLVLIAYDELRFGFSTDFNGYLYSSSTVFIENEGNFTGAISAPSLSLDFGSTVVSDLSAVEQANFNAFCTVTQPAQALASYQFEDSLWNGAAGEIVDSTGNGYDGRVDTGVVSADTSPALVGNPGTCGYADFNDGSIRITSLDVDTATTGAKTTVAFWMNWDGTNDVMPIGWNFHDLWLRDGFFGFNTWQIDLRGIESTGFANQWKHVVAEFTNGDVRENRLFIDGVEQSLNDYGNPPDNNLAFVNSELRIGGVANTDIYNFEGSLDEVRVYNGVLTDSEIQALYTETRPCAIEAPKLEYRFDELSWNGVSDEVLEYRNSGFDGVAIDDAQTFAAGQVCRAASFDGSNDRVDVSGFDTYLTSTATVSYWMRSTQSGNFRPWNAPGIIGLEEQGGTNDIFWGYIDASSRIGIQKGDGTAALSSTQVADGTWHHIVLTYNSDNGAAQVYVDGVLEGSAITDSGVITNAFGSIGRIDNSFSSINYIGDLDEVLVFDSILSADDIQTIYTNQLNGNNYDGTTRSCVSELVNYRMDEFSWSGAAAEVVDQAGSFPAQSRNGASTNDVNRAISGNPGTCGYGEFDGSDDYLALPASFGNLTDSFTITAWINPSNTDQGSRIFIDDEQFSGQQRGYGFSLGDSGSARLRFYSRNVTPIIIDTQALIPANTWTFVSAVHNAENKTREIYINGVLQTLTNGDTTSTYTGAWGEDDGIATIGGETENGETDKRFTGSIDEVRVYKGALSANEIVGVYNESHACPAPAVHHYEIEHDGQGLTCDAETITIKACEDAACSTLSSQAVSLDLLVDGSPVSSASFVGSTNLSFNNTDVETVILSIANESIVPSSALVCDDGTGNSCNMEFSDAGFRFLSGSSNSLSIANQTSGIAFPQALKIQAVKDTDGVCTALFSGTKTVQLSQENVNPGGTSGLSFNLGASSIAKHTGATSLSLSFDADSIATLDTPVYQDAGQIRLRASYSEAGINLIGSSNAFWVSPAALIIQAQAAGSDINGSSASSSVTHPAGEDFEFIVSAFNGAATPVITPNYSPGQIQMQLRRTAPSLASSVDGQLSYASGSAIASSASATMQNVTLTPFVSGVSRFSSANYSEVAILNLDLQDNNYGNQGIVIPANAINLGRFTPFYYEQTVADDGVLAVEYASASGTQNSFIAFSGQKDEATNSVGAISYLTNPTFAITAYNKQGAVTQNFYEDSQGSTNDFMTLSSSSVSVLVPTTDEVAIGVDGTLLSISANMTAGVLSQNDLTSTSGVIALPRGTVHYQLSSSDNFYYNRSENALVPPFSADIDFALSGITDADGVSATSLVDASPTGLEIRFGRMTIENSFGPETANFPQTIALEHFTAGGFVLSTDNSFVSYDPANVLLSNISLDPALSGVLGSTGNFVNGQTQNILLSATGAGNQGQIGVTYDAYEWLLFDWDNDGDYDDNPSAIATFGIYRGNDRTINWREVFND
ncbi:LamG domain-containing protein [Glaciecola sp. MH2013]|uniref:LamG domain-containing protein n=1 Tax=Glaciecola sp. MH2013 TaxID=2785524 RepID=UPI00189D8FD6|nr:LamG domain-containing protein [Glaciecola sp. MH2013]MBF7073702.1 LamG domain-containing protein [Glaciecola sp. MH2013]